MKALIVVIALVVLLLCACDLEYQVNGPPRDAPDSEIKVGPYSDVRVYDFDYAGRHYRMFVVFSSQIAVVEVQR